MNQHKFLLLLVIIVFLVTRFYKISQIPSSIYWDEASIGYNAYSVLKTGKDEWGEFLPIHFRAFGEFKLPIYIYSVALTEVIFGLSELAVRLPAVIFSLITILVTYFLGKRLSGENGIGLLSAFLMTISSWFFIFSRVGYEITAGLAFYLLGILLMLNYYKSFTFALLATFCFILSLYSYNSFRVITPITFIILLFFINNHKSVRKKIFYIITSVLLLSISIIPVVKVLVFDAGFGRVQSFTVFPTIKQVYDLEGKPKLQIIYDRSKDQEINISDRLSIFVNNYFVHLSPNFLLLNGDRNLRHQQSGFGQIYILDLPFVVLGMLYILKKKKKLLFIPLILLLISLIPAALFKEAPHALRSLAAAPFLSIISTFGIKYLGQRMETIYLLAIFIYLLLFGNYFWKFITNYPLESSHDFQYPYKQIYKKYSQDFATYNQIIISNQYAQPYIFALFYLKIPPEEFRKLAKYARVEDWGFSTVNQIGKFKFTKIDQKDLPSANSLIFVTPTEKLGNLKEVDAILNLDGSVGLYVYKI